MWILGLSGSHNGSVALIKDGRVAVAVQLERLSRQKRHPFRLDNMNLEVLRLIHYCLEEAGIQPRDIECVATTTPWNIIHPLFIDPFLKEKFSRFVTVPHHLAHAEYALHFSPMRENTLVLVADGSGTYENQRHELHIKERELNPIKHLSGSEKESISAYLYDGENLLLRYRIGYGLSCFGGDGGLPSLMESLGHIWRWAAWYCHGSEAEAGKVMGLAPFGDPTVFHKLRTVQVDENGKLHFGFAALKELFREPAKLGADVSGLKHYADIAAHVQSVTNSTLEAVLRFLLQRDPVNDICYSGGVALNGVANEHLIRTFGKNIFMNGSCEDNGTAIGAALAAYHAKTGIRVPETPTEYYGAAYSSSEIKKAFSSCNLKFEHCTWEKVIQTTAEALAKGEIVAWCQGRSEYGPRALGNRSILADPRRPDMQQTLNSKVKFRETFRPFAASVPEACAKNYFGISEPSPFMLRVVPTLTKNLPAITHVDGSVRVQTVAPAQNKRFHELLQKFGEITDIPVLLNTSFNVAGEPIVESPEHAANSFRRSRMDLLVFGNYMARK